MATTTPNYGLRKPENSDTVNVALDIAANMDLIDAHAHSGTYVALTGNQTVAGEKTFSSKITGTAQQNMLGNGADPNASFTQDVGLTVSTTRTNPTEAILQHFVGYSSYFGTPGGSVGTLQGGSCESLAFASPANMGTVLGFEGIGRASSDNNKTVDTVIGMQGTASAAGSSTVNDLVAVRAAGPNGEGGSPTVTRAKSIEVFEPTIGTTRQAIKSTGCVRLQKGTATNALEISTSGNTLQWASDGTLITGYASDGSSVRLSLDPQDTPTTARIYSNLFNSADHIRLQSSGSTVFSIAQNGTASWTGAGTIAASGSALIFSQGGTERFRLAGSGNLLMGDGIGFQVGTAVGTKIGTATSQKIAFFNATPIIQPTGTPAAATDLASVISLANSLRTNLLALGLVA